MKISGRILRTGIAILVLALPAFPQKKEILQLQGDMITLQGLVKSLQSSTDERNSVILSQLGKIADQVNVLSANLQKMNDTVGGLKSENDRTAAELRSLVSKLNDNVSQVTDGLAGVRTQIGNVSQQVTSMQSSAQPLEKPEDLMRTAYTDFVAGNYDLAISGYKEFLGKYAGDPRAGEAQLQVGESLFNQKKYDQAVIEYDTFLQKYPNHDKTRDALYKKGRALAEQNLNTPAINAFNLVVKGFPGTAEAVSAQQEITRLRTAPARR